MALKGCVSLSRAKRCPQGAPAVLTQLTAELPGLPPDRGCPLCKCCSIHRRFALGDGSDGEVPALRPRAPRIGRPRPGAVGAALGPGWAPLRSRLPRGMGRAGAGGGRAVGCSSGVRGPSSPPPEPAAGCSASKVGGPPFPTGPPPLAEGSLWNRTLVLEKASGTLSAAMGELRIRCSFCRREQGSAARRERQGSSPNKGPGWLLRCRRRSRAADGGGRGGASAVRDALMWWLLAGGISTGDTLPEAC